MDATFEAEEWAVRSFALREHPEFAPVIEGVCAAGSGTDDPCLQPLDRSKRGRWAVCRRCALAYRVLPGPGNDSTVYLRDLRRWPFTPLR
jgi:hypothetical protein